MILPLAVGILAALSIIIIFLGAFRVIEPQVDLDQRLYAELVQRRGQPSPGRQTEEKSSVVVKRLNRAFADRDFSHRLTRELLQADLRLTVSEYLLIWAACVLVAFLTGVLFTRNPLVGVVLAVVAFFLPQFYVRRRRQKRLQAFNDQLEDVLILLVGSLRAGHSLLQALNVVTEEIPPPASDEYRRVIREVGLGLSLQEALNNLVRRVQSDDLEMIVMAISIQQEVGGNLADILDTAAETIRERVRILGEIRVLTSRQRQTGYVLALLPFFLGLGIFFLNPEYIMTLFTPGPILIIPAGAVFLELIGFLVIQRIVDIKV